MIKKIFSIENIGNHKCITILGAKIKIKINKAKYFYPEYLVPSIYDLRSYIMASVINPRLEKYRGIFKNKEILIVGGGSSLEFFKYALPNTINIAINRAYQIDTINYDYIFVQDTFQNEKELQDLFNYKKETCKKFIGVHTNKSKCNIRQNVIEGVENKEIYVLNCRRPDKTVMPVDISIEPFAWYGGTVFAALQFCLFANAEKIYLAGFDCDNTHQFVKESERYDLSYQYDYWKQFKNYKDFYFPQNKIISINPINLKGLFEDVYTRNFVEHNFKDLDRTELNIIELDN